MNGIWISVTVGAVLFVVVLAEILFIVFMTKQMKRACTFSVNGHNILVSAQARGFFLYVDDVLEDVLAGQNLRRVMLRCLLDGTELRAEVEFRFRGTQIRAFYGGRELDPTSLTK